jgi:hypothetical protein
MPELRKQDTTPTTGHHITITGAHVLDTDHHTLAMVHPAYSLEILWSKGEHVGLTPAQFLSPFEFDNNIALYFVIRRYLPHLLVGISISLITVGAYAAVGFAASSSPKAIWSINPVAITFSGSGGIGSSGSVGELVKCAPKTANVNFKTTVSNPAKLSLNVGPTGETTCGPAPDTVTVTAHCLVASPNCKGTYGGTVTIFQGYSTIPPGLSITIVVT